MYKRQVQESASDAVHQETATGTEGVEQVLFTLPTPVSVKNGYAVLLPIADRNIPTSVSYTHLDVYKRQVQGHTLGSQALRAPAQLDIALQQGLRG